MGYIQKNGAEPCVPAADVATSSRRPGQRVFRMPASIWELLVSVTSMVYYIDIVTCWVT